MVWADGEFGYLQFWYAAAAALMSEVSDEGNDKCQRRVTSRNPGRISDSHISHRHAAKLCIASLTVQFPILIVARWINPNVRTQVSGDAQIRSLVDCIRSECFPPQSVLLAINVFSRVFVTISG